MRAELAVWGKIIACALGAGFSAYFLAKGFGTYFDVEVIRYGTAGKLEQTSRLIGQGSGLVVATTLAVIHWFRR